MINYLAVVVSAVVAMAIGAIWWGPLFGKEWIAANGLDKLSHEKQAEMKRSMGGLYVQQFLLSIISAVVLVTVIHMTNSTGAVAGIKVAVMLWLGFVLPVQYGQKLWGNKSYRITLLSLISSLITVIITGAILGAW